jgi:hypothetical protein
MTFQAAFKRSPELPAPDTCLETGENDPFLKMAERPDWALFRTIDGLQQKAGVPAARLRRLVLKELADNALDAGGQIAFGAVEGCADTHFVEDDGPGLDGTPEEIASLFSIRRPMRSSKLLREPQRGALGNGLRVVAGAVLASEGSLTVITRNQHIVISPQADGSTMVVKVERVDHPVGTRIEIGFGPELPRDPDPFGWVRRASEIASKGKSYEGKSSPFWYDSVQFHELLLAHGQQPVRGLIAQLDGCSGGKAGEIITAAKLERMACEQVTRGQATALLETARKQARPVNPERLGLVGRDAFPDRQYAIERGHAAVGSAAPKADIPFVVEAWAKKTKGSNIALTMLVNRTPISGEINSYRDSDKDICLFGCGLSHGALDAPRRGIYDILVNIITPYCPITSDGKDPNLELFAHEICTAIDVATRKAQRAAPKEKRQSQKDVVLDNLEDAIANTSGDGEYRFNERQIYYQLRPIVFEETGQPLSINNFKAIITDYENENGEIEDMYREPRGSIYHPHREDDIPLGTLTVEEYERPLWTFNKLLYIEKEGFSEALKDDGWPERHDCALMSSKGYTTRAARDLVDKLAAHDEPCTIYCVHDADAYGTMIYQTFQEATRARGARKVRIVNLGLEPWEAIELGLEVEDIEAGDRSKPIAEYILTHEDEDWEDWLQSHRIELNAMTTPEFIDWLDAKMAEHEDGKLIPPAAVIEKELEGRLQARIRAGITERILAEANFEGQVREALKAIKRPSHAELKSGIELMFDDSPEREWRAHIEAVVGQLSERIARGKKG